MRCNRIEHAQENRQAFAQHGVAAGAGIQFGRFQRVQHFHARRHHGVVLNAFEVVIGLLQGLVNFTPQGFLRLVEAAGIQREMIA